MSDSEVYKQREVDLGELIDCYNDSLTGLDEFFGTCQTSFDDRRNIWAGKSSTLRKEGAAAFPWQGASDQEVNVVGERLDTYVALFDQALQRSHIKAFPTSTATVPRAQIVSQFLKWMRSSYIPDFKGQMELAGNHLLEKGIMVTYVGWQRESRTFLQTVTLDQIAQIDPNIAQAILSETNDEAIAGFLLQAYPQVGEKRAMKAVRDLRMKGMAEIPIPRVSVDCPEVHTCAPDGEVFMPPYVSDPQRSPVIFWRTFYTEQELRKKVVSEGWDEAWVDYVCKNLKGKDSHKIDGERTARYNNRVTVTEDDDLIMVVHGFRRLIDKEDGSEGIYQTVFHPDHSDSYASDELLNGYDTYPFVFTRLSRDQSRIYESKPMTCALRGPQMQIKTERDSRVDRASLATMPPLMHPAGRPPSDWGPGRRVPYRRLGEIAFGPAPSFDSGSIEIESAMTKQADRAVGLDREDPLSPVRQQFYIGKFLDHARDVLALAFKLFQRVGPDEVFFQVSGSSNPQMMQKGSPDENYNIVVAFDSMSSDPETSEARIKQMGTILQFDRSGIVDVNKFLEYVTMAIDPVLADYILQPVEESASKMQKDVTDDLAKIFAGIEVPARPNGAQMALQIVQSYAQQPDIAQRLASDEAFQERLGKYAQQYAFALQQGQNAEIGRIGTNPAQMAGMTTQNMQQQ